MMIIVIRGGSTLCRVVVRVAPFMAEIGLLLVALMWLYLIHVLTKANLHMIDSVTNDMQLLRLQLNSMGYSG